MKLLYACILIGVLLLAAGWFGLQDAQAPLLAAERAFQAGDFARAATLYGQVAPRIADPGHAVFNRAAALYELSQYDHAQEDYTAVQGMDADQRTLRAAYDAGNCSLRQACAMPLSNSKPLLQSAIAEYEKCLTPTDSAVRPLSASARHNQELAKHLLAQIPPTPEEKLAQEQQAETKTGGDAKSPQLAMADPGNGASEQQGNESQSGSESHDQNNTGNSEGQQQGKDRSKPNGSDPTANEPQGKLGNGSQPKNSKGQEPSGSKPADEDNPFKQAPSSRANQQQTASAGNSQPKPEPEQQCPT